MSASRNGPLPLSRLLRGTLDPLVAKRGFAAADLIASWDDIVGERYAAFTEPEKIAWPRGRDGKGVLTVRVDGARAIYLQHEVPQFLDRINRFLGHDAIGDIRILQRTRSPKRAARPAAAPIPADEQARLDGMLADIEGDRLREALDRLGAGIAARRLARE